MKLNKKKVTALALIMSLIAILSFGTLAWFTDSDSVTNDFFVAGSEDEDPDEIFSVDVWEEGDDEDDGLDFEDILPGDTLDKVVHVENTGSYDQYIRVKITVSNASLWQEVYKANLIPVTEFVNVNKVEAWDDVYGIHSAQESDNFVYYLYYNTPLTSDDKETTVDEAGDIIVFTEAYIATYLTREQAATLPDGFSITVTADAVQTEHVGGNVYEAFKTVGMEIPVNTTYVEKKAELEAALAKDGFIVLAYDEAVKLIENYEIKNTVNIYLNERTLQTTRKNAGDYGLKITGDVTIGGYGMVTLDGDHGIYLNGKLSIYGGNFVDTYDRSCDDEALINIYEKGALCIYDGKFDGQEYCVYVRNGNGIANVYGGEFTYTKEEVKY